MNSMSDKNALHNPFKNLEREKKENKSTAQQTIWEDVKSKS